MLSDDSNVSAISSDDNAGQTTKAHKKTGYRLRNVLKPGRTTQYTAKALYGKQPLVIMILRDLTIQYTTQTKFMTMTSIWTRNTNAVRLL